MRCVVGYTAVLISRYTLQLSMSLHAYISSTWQPAACTLGSWGNSASALRTASPARAPSRFDRGSVSPNTCARPVATYHAGRQTLALHRKGSVS
jgi:hypothetical protein